MRRLNLPEILDRPTIPTWLRDAMTGFLQVSLELNNPYAVVVGELSELLRRASSPNVLDMASGGGGPWPQLVSRLAAEELSVRVTLSDLQPSSSALHRAQQDRRLSYLPESVSALEPPLSAPVRTMFTALHHFPSNDVRRIFQSAQTDRVFFLGAEATHRSLRGLAVTLIVPLLVFFLMPRVRPRKAIALVFTYILPILPFLIWWDAFASTFRTYRAEEFRQIAAGIAEPGYDWTVKEISAPHAPLLVTLVIGGPSSAV